MATKKSQCDFAFVMRPSEFGEYLPFPQIALSAYLKREGISVQIIDPAPVIKQRIALIDMYSDNQLYADYLEYVKKEIMRVNPKFIGVGSFTSDYAFIIDFARRVKEYSNAKIIVGNVHATVMPTDFIYKDSPVDIAVIGEGELTLTEILKTKKLDNRTLKKIKGICFLGKNGRPVVTKGRELIKDLSTLPMPDYESIDMSWYVKPLKHIIGFAYYTVVPLYSGRGCPFRCRFCAASTVWGGQRLMRPIPIDNVIKEIKFLIEKYKIDAFYIFDDTFTINKLRVLEFCEKIKPLKIRWAAQTRVNLVDDTLLTALKNSGCMQLTFGVETGSQKLLDSMQKDVKVEQIEKAFALCRKYKMRTIANMMFNLPGETRDDVEASYKLFKKLKATDFQSGLTVAYPGTKIYDENFPEKLRKDEYIILEGARGYDEGRVYGKGKFRLCAHDIDFAELLVDFRLSLRLQHLLPLFIRILFSPDYLIMIYKSKYKKEYIRNILHDIPAGLMRSGGMLLYNTSKLFPMRIRRPIINFANHLGNRYTK